MLTPAHKELFRMIRGWGGKTIPVTVKNWNVMQADGSETISFCPFDSWCGIDYKQKALVYVSARVSDIGVMIHETGHIFACKNEPYNSHEFDFFGWEYVMAQKLGAMAEWEKSTAAYGINYNDSLNGLQHYDEYGDLLNKPGPKKRFLKERLKESRELGLIVRGQPASIR